MYLVLNSFSVIPMYVSFCLVCFCTTVACYQCWKQCFPPNNKLHKIINKNTVKLSYSCMNNVQQMINSHNKTILTSAAENNNKLCNCREKNACPLNGKCLQKGVVYQATVVQKHTNQKDIYYKTYGRAAQHGRVYSAPEDSGRTFPLETQCRATMITR